MNHEIRKIVKSKIPISFEAALVDGWRVCEEDYEGELNRKGTMRMERIHGDSGDKETIRIPFVAKLKVGKPRGYRRVKHAYLTSDEAAQFEGNGRKTTQQSVTI